MKRALLTLVLLLQAHVMAQPAAGDAPVPLEDFTRHDDYGEVKISPDGEFIAVTTGKRSQLDIVALKDRDLVRRIAFDERGGVDDFHWTSPQHLIYMMSSRSSGSARLEPSGQVLVLDRSDGWRNRAFYAGTDYMVPLGVPKNDPERFVLLEISRDVDDRPLISSLTPGKGTQRPAGRLSLRDAHAVMDDNGEVRVMAGWAADGTPALRWRPKPRAEWTALDLPGFEIESIVPRHFSSDGRSMLMTAARAGGGLTALFRVNLESGATEKVHAFENEGVDVGGLVMDFSGHEPVGVYADADRRVYHWLRPDDPMAVAHVQLQRAFAGQNVRITSASRDGHRAIVYVDSDVSPGDYYLFDTKTAKADFLHAGRNWIDPRQMLPKQPVELTARDGLKLHGYVTRPAGDGPFPLVVFAHDGPYDTRDSWDFDPQVQLLASRGYAVLQVNFRGSPGYGTQFKQAGYKQWGGRVQDDLTDATRWAVAQGIARNDRICMYGMGFGGYSALMAAVREPDLYRCVISYGGFYDLGAMPGSNYIRGNTGGFQLTRMLGQDSADLRSRSPLHNVERIRAPALLIHGTRDRRVNSSEAERMGLAMNMAGGRAEVMLLNGEDHQPYGEDNSRAMYERILGFLDRYLKQASSAVTAAR